MLVDKYIVLVEDNPDDAALTIRAFNKSTLVNEVRWFADGVEVLEYLHGTGRYAHRDISFVPEVILLDVKLPRLDGLEVLAQLRAHPATRYVPVVMLTTSQEQDDLVKSYSLGANSYIRKPVDFNKFLEVVQTIGVYWLELNQAVH
jgi:two-component system response regulator